MIFLVCSLLLMPLASYGQESTGFNNSCLYEQEGLNLEGPTEFDCPKFVIESTDQIWNMYRDFDKIESYLHQYMTEDWESISVMGEYVRGMDELIRLVNITLVAFPDIQLHIVDTFCEGNDIDGYKTTTWYGVPNCFIKNFDGQWKYTSEINMPDSLALYSQFGATPPEETWVMPTDDCHQLFDWETGYINPALVPFQMRRDIP